MLLDCALTVINSVQEHLKARKSAPRSPRHTLRAFEEFEATCWTAARAKDLEASDNFSVILESPSDIDYKIRGIVNATKRITAKRSLPKTASMRRSRGIPVS